MEILAKLANWINAAILLLLALLAESGCAYQPTQFHFNGKDHTFTYTAETLGQIQTDYCGLSDRDKYRVMLRVERSVADGWLMMGCDYDPKIPDLFGVTHEAQ